MSATKVLLNAAALFTSMSMLGPKALTVSATIRFGASISLRLHWTPMAELLCSDSMVEMVLLADSRDLSLEYVKTTFAPRAPRSNAMASPMPLLAPVTMALVRVVSKTAVAAAFVSVSYTLPSRVRGCVWAILDDC